ncbi:MAG: hypothetical protein KDA61_18860, partial [Planctomycetales bacterium]|nr:hypothetical protein [Planctomycetales bacterium]
TAGNQWGGVAFFSGADETSPGDETLFIGDPGQYSAFGIDLKQGQTLPGDGAEGVPIDTALHRMIVELDFDDDGVFPYDDTYRLWVDSADADFPTHSATIEDSPIQTPWRSVRLQSAGGGEFFKVDNLIITDEPALVFSPTLNLLVNKATGEVSVRNTTSTPIEISAYSIESASGMLDVGALPGDFDADGMVDGNDFLDWQRQFPGLDGAQLALWEGNLGAVGAGVGGWSSLADQDVSGFPAGDGSGNGWEEGANPGPNEVAEYFLSGSSTIAASTAISLGNAYRTDAAGADDVRFVYRSNGVLTVGTVSYVDSGIVVAVPEPACVALVLAGALASIFSRSRRTLR